MPNQLTHASLLAVVLAACTASTGGDSTASHQQARSVYSVASTRLEAALKAIDHEALTANINSSDACAVSGDVTLVGSYDSVAGFDLTASFAACQESEGAIDGDLHWVETTSGAGIIDTWTGTLELTDATTTASCVFDYQSITSETGVTLSGTICGFDVSTDLDL